LLLDLRDFDIADVYVSVLDSVVCSTVVAGVVDAIDVSASVDGIALLMLFCEKWLDAVRPRCVVCFADTTIVASEISFTDLSTGRGKKRASEQTLRHARGASVLTVKLHYFRTLSNYIDAAFLLLDVRRATVVKC
jgi:hypothetical protein